MKHHHHEHCEHQLRYCRDCKAVYCTRCPDIFKTYSEWSREHRCYPWSYSTYTTQPVIGAFGSLANQTAPTETFTIDCAHTGS